MHPFRYAATVDYAILRYAQGENGTIHPTLMDILNSTPQHHMDAITKFDGCPIGERLRAAVALLEDRGHETDFAAIPKPLAAYANELNVIGESLTDEFIWNIPERLWPQIRNRIDVQWYVSLLLPSVRMASGRLGHSWQGENKEQTEVVLVFGLDWNYDSVPDAARDIAATLRRGVWYYLIKEMTRTWLSHHYALNLNTRQEEMVRKCILARFVAEEGVDMPIEEKFTAAGLPQGAILYRTLRDCPWRQYGSVLAETLEAMDV